MGRSTRGISVGCKTKVWGGEPNKPPGLLRLEEAISGDIPEDDCPRSPGDDFPCYVPGSSWRVMGEAIAVERQGATVYCTGFAPVGNDAEQDFVYWVNESPYQAGGALELTLWSDSLASLVQFCQDFGFSAEIKQPAMIMQTI